MVSSCSMKTVQYIRHTAHSTTSFNFSLTAQVFWSNSWLNWVTRCELMNCWKQSSQCTYLNYLAGCAHQLHFHTSTSDWLFHTPVFLLIILCLACFADFAPAAFLLPLFNIKRSDIHLSQLKCACFANLNIWNFELWISPSTVGRFN